MRGVDRHPELPVDPDADTGQPDDRLRGLLLVALGGAAGTLTRYGLGLRFPSSVDGWPVATFVANVAGAFALGALLEGLARRGPDTGWRRRARLAAGTGFCGALTTYSTLAVETDLLGRAHHAGLAVAYAVASVFAGLVATIAGVALASGRRGRRA